METNILMKQHLGNAHASRGRLRFGGSVSEASGLFVLCPPPPPHREEVEMLLSPLEPQYCVEQAMNAILIDQPLVCIPRLTYLPVISRAYVEMHLCVI